jgi:aminoglycoside 6'-N-acetyltransferase I
MADIFLLTQGDGEVLDRVAADVFDSPVRPSLVKEFLGDPRHHLAVARVDGTVIGFASAVHYVHPDKAPELWINEVGVAPPHQREGIGRKLVLVLLGLAEKLGCRCAWVLTERDNQAAVGLYRSAGGVEDEGGTVLFEFPLRGESVGSSLDAERIL